MGSMRKPFQGVLNIIRFNWHFYLIAFFIILFINIFSFLNPSIKTLIDIVSFIIFSSILLSLLVSYYIYDVSNLYLLKWINKENNEKIIVNIHAGFDETSCLLKSKFKNSELFVYDFYNPIHHKEVSIKRARKAYPPFKNTINTTTTHINLLNNSADKIFVVLAAHEIRNEQERILFFKELFRIIKPLGEIYIVEHLRDFPNLIAFNFGYFHFFSKKSWVNIFKKVSLELKSETKITPFISSFILQKNDTTY